MTKYEDFKHAKIQTWVLKVSIHDCKKCYKKVERVLHSIDGVDNFIIDAGKQKLTVTGNVHSEMLLKELRKSFKNADLWPVAQNKEPETPKQQEGQKSGKDDSGDAIEHAAIAKKGNDNGYNENSGGGNECSGGEGASDTIAIIVCVVGRFLSEFLFAILGILLLALSDCVFTIFGSRHEDHEQVEEDTLFSGRQREFGMDTLAAATNNFDSANKLGQGGFGPVYKGTTPNGQQIAVKKLSSTSNQGRIEFLNEVKLLANIQHRNFVKLLGCCAEGSERLLVYEYLRNGSLDKFLSDADKRKELIDWEKRYNIIMGIARGLLYLHQDSQLRIVHRDIKASNILLDDKLNPKIADFGTARLFHDDQTHVNTGLVGTFGYMAPEYVMEGRLSVNADVYSFGIVLLEIVTGCKSIIYGNSSSEMPKSLAAEVWSSYKQGKILQRIDRSINKACDKKQAGRCIHVGLLCTQADSELRPSMLKVIEMLSTPSVALPVPTKPPLGSTA